MRMAVLVGNLRGGAEMGNSSYNSSLKTSLCSPSGPSWRKTGEKRLAWKLFIC